MSGHELEDLVSVWLKRYETEKERQFIKCVDRFIPSDQVRLLDIGCGIGLHTYLWSERNKQVSASDSSAEFRDHFVRTYRFPFIWNDVLNSTINQQYDICFCMAIGTILHDEGPRFQTFETLAGLVRAGSFLVLITCSNQWPFRTRSNGVFLHCLDERDAGKLKGLGLEIQKVFYWSSSPRFLWRSPGLRWLGRLVEEIGFRLGIGARKVMICQRKPSGKREGRITSSEGGYGPESSKSKDQGSVSQ
jgi:SAM-dependent methyltransferase